MGMQPSLPAPYRPSAGVAPNVGRWITIWAGLLALVTIVVVLFLIAIGQVLASINGHLATARDAVVDIGGETKTLPRQVDNINNSLTGIEDAVDDIFPGAVRIRDHLNSIDAKLGTVDSSVATTSGSLVSSLGLVSQTRGILINADNPPDRLGVQNIHQRVARANGVGDAGPFGHTPNNLSEALRDTGHIVCSLSRTNENLNRACGSVAVNAVPPPGC
jgi:hypothetical protein